MSKRTHLYFKMPRIEDGETVYSCVARYHLLAAHAHAFTTLEAIFGSRHCNPASEFPNGLDLLSTLTGDFTEKVAKSHTTIPLYRPFLSEEIYRTAVSKLCLGDGTALHSDLANIANHIKKLRFLRFCPSCSREDMDRTGHSIWHVVHQLPGYIACTRHGNYLQSVEKRKNRLVVPSQVYNVAAKAATPEALQASRLFESAYRYSDRPFDPAQLVLIYRKRLANCGLLLKSGWFRQKECGRYLREYWSELFSDPLLQIIDNKIEIENFPSKLIKNPGARHSPIMHLMLIGFAFGTWEKFLHFFNSHGIRELDPSNCMPIGREDCFHDQCQLAIDSLRRGKPLKSIVESTGISSAIIKSAGVRYGISSKRRRYNEPDEQTLRAIWRQLVIGRRCEDIASTFGVSVKLVNKILTTHPEIISLRSRVRIFQLMSRHRSAVTQLIESRPSITRSVIREVVPQSFQWLYQNDRDWLFGSLPAPIPRNQRSRRRTS